MLFEFGNDIILLKINIHQQFGKFNKISFNLLNHYIKSEII